MKEGERKGRQDIDRLLRKERKEKGRREEGRRKKIGGRRKKRGGKRREKSEIFLKTEEGEGRRRNK